MGCEAEHRWSLRCRWNGTWEGEFRRVHEDRTRHGRYDVPVNPYPEPDLRLADRDGYPFATSQAELARYLTINSPEETALTDEYGPRG